MAIANEANVLADFNDSEISHHGVTARFFRNQENFVVSLTENDSTSSYVIAYSFGHFPLQQYLVATEGGRYQVIPFSWDSRKASDGGQRWYPNYQEDYISENDRLHWTQPLQNWNGMCADCHSDGLTRNFDLRNNEFNTTWDNINVGCQSCHGDQSDHAETEAKRTSRSDPIRDSTSDIQWVMTQHRTVAQLLNTDGEPASTTQVDDRREPMNVCFACHSLREPLNDGINPSLHFLDQLSPLLLSEPLYYADGQIREEVYVYGSFLQSKMYQSGVTCMDCHNPHTAKVKIEGNGLCLQCHQGSTYQSTEHTRHPLESEAGQCVSCHMPETTYMGVDDRRDHSFTIPRPHLGAEFNTPNACVGCHQDQSNEWATTVLQQWYGDPMPHSRAEQAFIELLHNGQLPLPRHLALADNSELPEIKRASVIALLPNSTEQISDYLIRPWVESDLPLIRLATARIGHLLSTEDRTRSYARLLDDEYRAVRVAAATHLVGIDLEHSSVVTRAFNELAVANDVNSWRGEGNLNQSLVDANNGRISEAIRRLQFAIEIDPYFEPAYVNLADLYRSQNELRSERQVYLDGLENVPQSASIHFSYGMHLIRTGQREEAVDAFGSAMSYDPQNLEYAYLYFLALDATNQTARALSELKVHIARYNTPQFIEMGLSFAQKTRDRESYNFFASRYQPAS